MSTSWTDDTIERELARRVPVRTSDFDGAARSPSAAALLVRILDLDPGPAGQASRRRGAWPFGRRLDRRVVVAVAAALVVAAGVGSAVFTGMPGALQRTTTPWRAARPLPEKPNFVPGNDTPGRWQLVGDFEPAGWSLGTVGGGALGITCPTASVCYAVSTIGSAWRTRSPSSPDRLYVSGDGGQDWSVLPFPSGFSLTSPLSCAGATVCAAGGMVGSQPQFAETSDGGHQWTVSPLGATGVLLQLACSTTSACYGIAAPTSVVTGRVKMLPHTSSFDQESFVGTTNAGSSWVADPLPAQDHMTALSCTSPSACIALGYPVDAPPPTGVTQPGFVLTTDDGGNRWRPGSIPPGVRLDVSSTMSCGSAGHCLANGHITVPDPTPRCVGTPPALPPGSRSCSTSPTTSVSAVVTTADGGASWHLRQLPSTVSEPVLVTSSCAGPTLCWVAGSQRTWGEGPPEAPVLLGTTDGGSIWTAATASPPQGAPQNADHNAYSMVGSISCPTPQVCVALGAIDQGQTFAPVYRFEAPGGTAVGP